MGFCRWATSSSCTSRALWIRSISTTAPSGCSIPATGPHGGPRAAEAPAGGVHPVLRRLGALPLWAPRSGRGGRLRAADLHVARRPGREDDRHRLQHGHGRRPRPCPGELLRARRRRGGAGRRAAAHTTLNRRVGVIATKGTVDSNAYSDAIRHIDAGHHRVLHGDASVRGDRRDGAEALRRAHRGLHGRHHQGLHPPGVRGHRPAVPGAAASLRHRHARFGLHPLSASEGAHRGRGGAQGHAGELGRRDGPRRRSHPAPAPRPRPLGNVPVHSFFTTADDVEEFRRFGGRVLARPMDVVAHVDLPAL